jgi:hypothetical protein
LVLFTTSTAKVDLPEAGIPAIPTNKRLSEGILCGNGYQDVPLSSRTKRSLSESFDGGEREVISGGVHHPSLRPLAKAISARLPLDSQQVSGAGLGNWNLYGTNTHRRHWLSFHVNEGATAQPN